MAETRQFCTFVLEDRWFGVEVDRVQEVLRHQPVTRVPLAPEELRGLINLRGQIVTAFDLRRCLGLAPVPPGSAAMNLVVRDRGEAVSLQVDAIGDVLEVDASLFETPPETLTGLAREFVRGAYKLKGHLLLVLDTDRILMISEDK